MPLGSGHCCRDCCKISHTLLASVSASFSSMHSKNKTKPSTLSLIWRAILNTTITHFCLLKSLKTVLQESGGESGISHSCKKIWVNKYESLEVSIETLCNSSLVWIWQEKFLSIKALKLQLVWSFSAITALYNGTGESEKCCLCEKLCMFKVRLSWYSNTFLLTNRCSWSSVEQISENFICRGSSTNLCTIFLIDWLCTTAHLSTS